MINNKAQQPIKYLDMSATAKMLSVSPATVRRMEGKAGFPVRIILTGQTKRFKLSELKAYLDAPERRNVLAA